jgi:hypothetical protein
MTIFEQFKLLLDPSTARGAFIISISASVIASFVAGFFTGKTVTKVTIVQKGKNVGGDMIQNSVVKKR